MYSLVLKNATVIDGTGKPAYQADLGIAGDKIAAIGEIQQAENAVDVSGMVVTPGFIDPHSHADCSIFLYPDCESYVRQGITTFVGGQCGDSNAPIRRYWMRKYWEYDMWDAIDPYIYGQTTPACGKGHCRHRKKGGHSDRLAVLWGISGPGGTPGHGL